MKYLTASISLFIAFVFAGGDAVAQAKRPLVFVNKGACPFECCTYQRWTVAQDTVAYNKPYKGGKRVGVFKKGTRVRGLTGEVRTLEPGKFVIIKKHEQYMPGDILWVYTTTTGEGTYRVWFKGRMYPEQLDYISDQSALDCQNSAECWGHLEKDYQTEWWVKVRSSAGWVGWTDKTNNFRGMDGCE